MEANLEKRCTRTIQKRDTEGGYVAQGAFESGKKSRRRIDEDETNDRRHDGEAYALV